MRGDTVRLPAPARRVVSLIPATTELLFAIGAGSVVVGRTSSATIPPAARRVPNLGDGIKPEHRGGARAAAPTSCVLYNSAQNAAVAGRLRALGIPALRINTDAPERRRPGRPPARPCSPATSGGRLGRRRVRHRPGAPPPRLPPRRRPKVLLLVWEQPPMTIGRGSFLSELVERAGGENLFADVTTSSGVVSIEAVAARDPDLILTTTEGPAAFASGPEWQVVPRGARAPLPPGDRLRVQPAEPSRSRRRSAKLTERMRGLPGESRDCSPWRTGRGPAL